MRTFVALNLPSETRAQLQAALAPLRDADLPVRWAKTDGIHLTLKFLGDVEPDHVAQLGATMENVASKHAPFSLRIERFGAFPSIRRAKVLWVGVDAGTRAVALQRDLDDALCSIGYPREQRPFRPHVTVARTRGGAPAPDISRLADGFAFGTTARIDTVDLMQSHLGRDGSRYEALLEAPLGARAE